MNTESDTPRTDAQTMSDDYDHIDTDFGPFPPSITVSAEFARQLERELNAAMAALRNLTHEIGRHESAIWMHPRLTRAITAATKLTTETK